MSVLTLVCLHQCNCGGESLSQSRWKAAKYPVIWTEQTKKDPVSNLHMWGVQVWSKSKAVRIQSVYVERQ